MKSVFHVPTMQALVEITSLSIADGDDEDFIDEVKHSGGFEVWSYRPIWRHFKGLSTLAANQELFPIGGPDEAAFLSCFEFEGASNALKWLRNRYRVTRSTSYIDEGRGRSTSQFVVYVPVKSKLEEALTLKRVGTAKRKPERFHLMEE